MSDLPGWSQWNIEPADAAWDDGFEAGQQQAINERRDGARMKVHELIAELQKYDPNEEVFIMAGDWYVDTVPCMPMVSRYRNEFQDDDPDTGKIVLDIDRKADQ